MKFVTRPSSLPAQSVSPRWESKGYDTVYTIAGTDRHAALEALLKGDDSMLGLLNLEDSTAVQWAANLVKTMASLHGLKIETEVPLSVIKPNGVQILQGTVDVVVGNNIFDLKWRDFDYTAQMYAYALGLMQRNKCTEVGVHVMYGANMRVESYQVTMADVEGLVFGTVANVADPTVPCKPSRYCGQCKHESNCKWIRPEINKIADRFQVATVEDLDVIEPERVAAALELANLAENWAAAVKTRAKQMMIDGLQVPGYSLQNRAGGRQIESERINDAYANLGIPHQSFMQACSISITALESAYALSHNVSKAKAQKDIDTKLAGIISHKPSTIILKKNR